MTCRGHSATFSGCILFKRQKNIRTKEFIECSKDRSSELDVHLFIQCDTPLVLGLRLLLLERNEEVDAYYLLFLLRMYFIW